MAARRPSCSLLYFFILLLFLALGHLQNIEDNSTSNLEDVSEDIQNFDDFADHVQLAEAPEYVTKSFEVAVVYRCKERRFITIEVLSRGVLEMEKTEFRYKFVAAMRTQEAQTRKVRVILRDTLVYRDNNALNITSDLHTNIITVVVSIMDADPWISQASESPTALSSNIMEMQVVSPWSRPEKPGYCFPWFWKYIQHTVGRRVQKCGPLNDIQKLVDFPIAIPGGEHGLKKFLPHLYWPDMDLVEAYKHSKPRFTISTWLYILDLCPHTLCSILNHKNKNFLTPVISFTQSSQLHVQVHYEDGTAFAFLINAAVPWNTWVHLVISVDDKRVEVSTRYGENFYRGTRSFHPHFPYGSFHFRDTEGYWVIGGTSGLPSFKGFIGPTTIYRTKAITISEIPLPPKDHSMFAIGLVNRYHRCSLVSESLASMLEQYTRERLTNESCLARPQSKHDWHVLTGHAPSTRHQCDVTLSKETPEIDALVLHLLRNSSLNMTAAADHLYQLAVKALTQDTKLVPWALGLLRVSGCLGNVQAPYTSAVIYMTGIGLPRDTSRGWLNLLVGAVSGHALSQMSLGFRHLIGADGVYKDCDAAAGYYKMAAVTTDNVLKEHHAVHTHSEAVRLDDYDELANHRGTKSDLFQWLSHQAMQGLSDAQSIMGEMHYYGKRGFQRDLTEAAKFYKMSASKGNREGLFNLGISKLKGHGTEKNETEAIELIQKAADLGLGAALNALGFYEVNMRRNFSGGALYFMRAAKTGDRDGLYNLGVAYDNGWVDNQPPNKTLAYKHFEAAANRGHPGACVHVGEELRVGQHMRRNCGNSVVFLRYLAEQHPQMGWLLRNALDAYYTADWYKSLVYFLLAAEAGMEVPQYNTALLCEENTEELQNKTAVDCIWRYYNTSAQLGWVYSMMKIGDNHWYGTTVPSDTSAAALMYAKAAEKDGHPHALYNLAYMVEYNYSLPGIQWGNASKGAVQTGNLSAAAIIYRKCRDTKKNGNESYLPCALGVVRVTVKEYYNNHPLGVQVFATAGAALLVTVTLCLALVDDRMV